MNYDCPSCGNHHCWPGERCVDCGAPYRGKMKINEPMAAGLLKGGIVTVQQLCENFEIRKSEEIE